MGKRIRVIFFGDNTYRDVTPDVMIAFDQRDSLKQNRKDLKIAIKEAEEYIENCSHSIGPRPEMDQEIHQNGGKTEPEAKKQSKKSKASKQAAKSLKSTSEQVPSPSK